MSNTGLSPEASVEFIDRDILVIHRAFNYGKRLIEAAERLPALWQTGTVKATNNNDYAPDIRRCNQLLVTGEAHASLETFESLLFGTVGSTLQLYVNSNPHILVTEDYGYSLVRYKVGDFFKTHADSRPGLTEFSGRRVSVLLYPNDDYEGGELVFPRQNFTFRPEAGSVVMFPSFYTHPHESKPILRGSKYAVASWLY